MGETRNRELNRIRWTSALAGLGIALACGALAAYPASGRLEGLSLDALTALRYAAFGERHAPSLSPSVVIAIDRDTFRAAPFKGSPTILWTRDLGKVITGVLDGGAEVVGFDVVFPTSIEESEIAFDDETIGARMRGFDRDFLRVLATGARAGKIVLGETRSGDAAVMPAAGQRAAVGQQRNIRSLDVHSGADGVVRRVPLMFAGADKEIPSLSLELAARALGVEPEVQADHSVTLADYRIPAYAPNALTLNFEGGSDDIPTYSLADLAACLGKGDAGFFARNFAGKVVLLGSTLDFEDDKATSKRFVASPRPRPAERCALPEGASPRVVRNTLDGVYIHATAINNLLRHEAVDELAGFPRAAVIAAGGAAGAVAASFLGPVAAVMAMLLGAVIWIAGATAAFEALHALPLVETLVAGALALVATTAFRLFVADKDRRFLRRTFELYLAPAVIAKMVAASRPPALGGELRDVTLFFSDLVGFSAFAETMRPDELVALMNRYLTAMTGVIEAHGGFVDKYIGDAIVAMFGAPSPDPDHAARATRAALACSIRLEALNRETAGAPRLAHRIGLNTGEALVGNVGSERRFNYTALGDAVNLGSRLESANRFLGTSILASESTRTRAGADFVWREIDTIQVKGRAETLRVFEPLAEAGRETCEQLAGAESYAEGLALWRAGEFISAAHAFARCGAEDSPAARFRMRAVQAEANPPEADWRPVNVLDEK